MRALTTAIRWLVGTPLLWVGGWNLANILQHGYTAHWGHLALVGILLGSVITFLTFLVEEVRRGR